MGHYKTHMGPAAVRGGLAENRDVVLATAVGVASALFGATQDAYGT